jgi:cystathionine beta-lyase
MSFDDIIDRSPTYSMKWDKYQGTDILPMWVADMEFRCAPPILEAIEKRTREGIFGYTKPDAQLGAVQAVCDWLVQQYDWHIQPEWLVWVPGVVPGFNLACRAFSEANDKVIIQTPNYPPLLAAPAINQMQAITVPTLESNGRWMIDFDQLRIEAANSRAKLIILCNPMNPVGTVWEQSELDQLAQICQQHDLVLCSDEIHCDLILDEQARHLPAGKHPQLVERSVTLMAASKTFNVAGLGTAFAIIPDKQLRQAFNRQATGIMPWVTVLGQTATEAAFKYGGDWYQELLVYLRGNRDWLLSEINQIPGLRALTPQATFLVWIDASGLGVENPQAYFEAKGIGPSPGADFGNKQFVRINFGCPRAYLQQMIERLKA